MLARLDVEHAAPSADPPRNPQPSRAIVFLIDATYLELMKVFCYSLARCGTLNHVPVIVLSEDPDVLTDPFLAQVADRREAIQPALLRQLEDAAGRAYKRAGKESWNRATFFKWAVFNDWGVDEALFLDCDMVMLRDMTGLFESSDADLVGAPQFQNELYKDKEGNRHSQDEMSRRIRGFVDHLQGNKISLNSGVMLMRRNVLNRRFLSELLHYTELHKAVNEQQFIAKFMKSQMPGRLQYISPIYNFQHSFLVRLRLKEQIDFLGRISVLHYAGRDKPWVRRPSRPNLGSTTWGLAVQEAEAFYKARNIPFTSPAS